MLRKRVSVLLIIVLFASISIPVATPALAETKEEGTQPQPIEDQMCTMVGVGKQATVNGSTIIAQSADCGICDPTYELVPAEDHEPGDRRPLHIMPQLSDGECQEKHTIPSNYTIPEVSHTYQYFEGVFGHMNEKQVAIAESTRGSVPIVQNEEALLGITELSMIALERAETAREAIKIMGSIAEKYGFNGAFGGESLLVSDPNEVWLFEIVGPGPEWSPKPETGIDPDRLGAAWAAKRVPKDEVIVMPNLPRIGEVNTEQPNTMASTNIKTLAKELGLWTPKNGTFKMYEAYSNAQATPRLWVTYHALAPNKFEEYSSDLSDYPFSFKPENKLSVRDVMEVYRNNGQGTQFDNTEGLAAGPWENPYHRGSNRLVPYMGSEYTVINQCRDWLPDSIGGISWIAPDNAQTSTFVPIYSGVNKMPEPYTIGNHHNFTRESAWWAHNFVGNWATLNWANMEDEIRELQNQQEKSIIEETKKVDQQAYTWYRVIGKSRAEEYVTQYTIQNSEEVVSEWWNLADKLVANYDDNAIGIPCGGWCYPEIENEAWKTIVKGEMEPKPSTAFKPIQKNLVRAYEANNPNKVYNPKTGENTIQKMKTGKAYVVIVNSNTTLKYGTHTWNLEEGKNYIGWTGW